MTVPEVQERWRLPQHSRLFVVGDRAPTGAPSWLSTSTADFVEQVSDRAYPCHFGRQSLGAGDVFGTWLGGGDAVSTIAGSLATFLRTVAAEPRRRAVLACFVDPSLVADDHRTNERSFWQLLHALHASDARPWPSHVALDPDEPAWEFCFQGQSMFVFAAAPTHRRRASRCLGDSLVLLFQPRHVFEGIEGGTPPGDAARAIIRRRVADWDLAPPHPAMGTYGDTENREWTQYFIDDDENQPLPTRCPFAPDGSWRGVIGWIEDQAQRTPDAVALVDRDGTATYAEMMDRVVALGGRLTAAGVEHGARVGVLVDRSQDSVIALLACQWAGCAYVPVDPGGPHAGRGALLDQAGVHVVLCSSAHVGAVPPSVDAIVLTDEQHGRRPGSQERVEVGTDDLAYVIHTSGSGGAAKGVAVSHGQLASAVFAQQVLDRPAPEVFLLPVSLCSDAAGAGLYWTLSCGGRVVVPADEEVRDVAQLRRLATLHRVTHTDSTPSLYDRFLGEDASGLESLRCVQVGGEACPTELLARHRRLLPHCVFENNYGPTEATVWASAHVVAPTDRESYDDSPHLPIGEAVHGAGVLLLADDLHPVAGEHDGEIYVSGEGVALGYLGRPAATAERFLPDPFTSRPGWRMYRTGDRARRDGRGWLHFLGRRDQQVKLRGFRVELSEVEEALHSHPDVDEACAVVVRVEGDDTLVGLVRARGRASNASLVAHLVQRLPGHAVPRRYVRLEEFPRLVSGKVDRRRLTRLALTTPATQVPPVPERPA